MSMTPLELFLPLVLVALWTAGSLVLGVVMGWRMRGGQAPLAHPFPPKIKETAKPAAVPVKPQQLA